MTKQRHPYRNPTCPKCSRQMGTLVSANPAAVLSVGDATICLFCGSYLLVSELLPKEERIVLKEMGADEILALPDEDRIALNRLTKILNKVNLGDMEEDLKAYTTMKEKLDEHLEVMVKGFSKVLNKVVGAELGIVVVVKHRVRRGMQMQISNMEKDETKGCIEDALNQLDPSEKTRRIQELLYGKG